MVILEMPPGSPRRRLIRTRFSCFTSLYLGPITQVSGGSHLESHITWVIYAATAAVHCKGIKSRVRVPSASPRTPAPDPTQSSPQSFRKGSLVSRVRGADLTESPLIPKSTPILGTQSTHWSIPVNSKGPVPRVSGAEIA